MPRALQAQDAPRLRELEFNGLRDGLITGVSGALWLSSETFLKSRLAPSTCRWCDRSADGRDTLNPVDRWGRGVGASSEAGRKTWDTASNVADFLVLPVGVLGGQYLLSAGSGAPVRYFAEDAVIIVETAVVSTLVNQVVKFAVGRERPFVHVLNEEQKGLIAHPSDNNLSFYSGHTNVAFSLVAAAGTVSQMRGYRHAWASWAVGIPAAASIGLMRMGADKHYLTDVLVGAAAGTAFGVGLPLLLHGRTPSNGAGASAADLSMRVSGAPGGFSLSGQF